MGLSMAERKAVTTQMAKRFARASKKEKGGILVELCALTCLGALATRQVSEIAAAARTIGFERCTLATDYGQKVNVRPAEGFQAFADALFAEGLDEGAIRRMACENPRALLRLPA